MSDNTVDESSIQKEEIQVFFIFTLLVVIIDIKPIYASKKYGSTFFCS